MIEALPNELFVELFEYLAPQDLYRAFSTLNSRFDALLRSLDNLQVVLEEDWDSGPRTAPSFASHVSTLIVLHDEPIEFSSYVNIRSLRLLMPTKAQCDAIQPASLPNLESLAINNFFFSDHSKHLCRLIFSPAFARLRTCRLDRLTLDASHPHSSPSLRCLTISPSTWKQNSYPEILRACPNLISLRIERLRTLTFDLSPDDIAPHRALRSLHMRFYSISDGWHEHLRWLLLNAPHLESLTVLIDYDRCHEDFSFALLARLLEQHAPNLTTVSARIPLNRILPEKLQTIKALHPLFHRVQFHGRLNRDLNRYLLISSNK